MAGYLEFDDYADLEVPINTDFSICGWIYISAYPTAANKGYVYCKGSATGAAASACHMSIADDGLVTLSLGEGTEESAAAFPTGEWVFLWARRIGTGADNCEMGWTPAAETIFIPSSRVDYSDNTTIGDNAEKATFFAKSDASGDDALIARVDQWYFSDSYGYTYTELAALYNAGLGTEVTSIAGRSNRVYFSDLGDFDTYTSALQYIDIPTNNKQQSISCLAEYYDSLIIGLSNEIWILYGSGGNPETDWALKKSNSSVGMKENSSTAIVNGLLMFVSTDGKLWAFDGNSSQQIGEKLDDALETGHQTIVNFNGDLYGILANGGTYSFDSTRNIFRKSDQVIRSLFTDGVYLYGGSNSSTRVFQLEETDSMGANAVNGYWQSRWEDFGMPHKAKTVFDMFIYCKEQTHGGNLNISFYKDFDDSTAVATYNVSQDAADNPENGQRFLADLTGVRGNHWALKVWNDQADQKYELTKLVLRYSVEEDES